MTDALDEVVACRGHHFAPSVIGVLARNRVECAVDETDLLLRAHNGGNRLTHKLLHYIADRRTHKDRWEAAIVRAQENIGLINGALDPVSGKHAYDKWRDVVPNARHHLLPSVGHYPQVEAPAEVAAKTLEWLG